MDLFHLFTLLKLSAAMQFPATSGMMGSYFSLCLSGDKFKNQYIWWELANNQGEGVRIAQRRASSWPVVDMLYKQDIKPL